MKKVLKALFISYFAYSWISYVAYIGTEQALEMSQYMLDCKKGKTESTKLKVESLWVTTIQRFKKVKENYKKL